MKKPFLMMVHQKELLYVFCLPEAVIFYSNTSKPLEPGITKLRECVIKLLSKGILKVCKPA